MRFLAVAACFLSIVAPTRARATEKKNPDLDCSWRHPLLGTPPPACLGRQRPPARPAVSVKEPPLRPAKDWLPFWPFKSSRDRGSWFGPEHRRKFVDDVVFRFNLTTVEEQAALQEAVNLGLVEMWHSSSKHADIQASKKHMGILMNNFLPQSMKDQYSILIPDVARAVAATFPSSTRTKQDSGFSSRDIGITSPFDSAVTHKKPKHGPANVDDLFFRDYQPMAAIDSWMSLLESMFSTRGIVTKISIGKSYEGRDIPALRIGRHRRSHSPSGKKPRRTLLFNGGFHGREWISPAVLNHLAWSFITSYGRDPLVTKMINHFDFVFIPVMNPDGYEFTWKEDRLWSKTRQPTTVAGHCRGFDLDHVFGYQWNAAGRADQPCAPDYVGTAPFQAVEATALAQWVTSQLEDQVEFVAYLNLQSYSQQILWPYSYSCEPRPHNWENMVEVAMNMAKTMRLSHGGERYRVGSACRQGLTSGSNLTANEPSGRGLQLGGGSAIDYFHHEIGARYSYQIQLRDTGMYGYLLPGDQIIPTGEEFFKSIKFLGDFLLGNNGIETVVETEVATKEDHLTVIKHGILELRRR